MTTPRECFPGGDDFAFKAVTCPIIRETCRTRYMKPCMFFCGGHVTRIPGQPEVRSVDCAYPDPTPETPNE